MCVKAHEELTTFLQAIWPDLQGQWLLFWGAPSKRSVWCQAITEETIRMLETWAQLENVYMGCGLHAVNHGPTLRGEKADVVAIPGVWLDIDYGPGHKKPNIPPTEADAHALLAEMGLPPSLVIHSGHGLQAWWLFKELWRFDRDAERFEAEQLTKGWCSTLRAKAKAHGWDADQVGDLTRVMRVPGTWNRKGIPRPVRGLTVSEIRFNASDISEHVSIGIEPAPALASLVWTFELSPQAEPPGDKFILLSEIDQIFLQSWRHSRPELQDQSASSFDLALATRALRASWTGQEIVNLLIAHRRKHGADLKLRRDYYERTLNAAASGKGMEERQEFVEDLRKGEPLPASVAKDPAESLAVLSQLLGVQLTKFVRYRSSANSYQLTVNGAVVNIPKIDLLDSQTAFRRLLLDHTDVRIHTLKAAVWGETVRQLFSTVQSIEAATEATTEGVFERWIELYLSEQIASEEEWQAAALMNLPFRRDGCLYVVSEGLRRFIWGKFQERLTMPYLAVQLTKLGYHSKKFSIRVKNIVSSRMVWSTGGL